MTDTIAMIARGWRLPSLLTVTAPDNSPKQRPQDNLQTHLDTFLCFQATPRPRASIAASVQG